MTMESCNSTALTPPFDPADVFATLAYRTIQADSGVSTGAF